MGYETNLFCNIHFNRKTYNHKSEVEEDIKELNECIEREHRKITAYALMTEPNKFITPEEGESVYEYIQREIEFTFKALDEAYWEKNRLELLLYNWKNCHNEEGLAIPPPNYMNLDTAYLDGDYIETIESKEYE